MTRALNALRPMERYVLIALFAIHAAAQLNAALHHGSHGQDVRRHVLETIQAADDPAEYVRGTYTYAKRSTDPPLYPLFCGAVFDLVGEVDSALQAIAFLQIALNALGFYLLYRVLARLIASPVLRLACMTLILFVPFARITSVVLSADGFATPLFMAVAYGFTLLVERSSMRRHVLCSVGLLLLLLTGLVTKYTFVSAVAASPLIIALLLRIGLLDRKRALISLVCTALIPASLAWAQLSAVIQPGKRNFEMAGRWINPLSSPYMDLRSLLFPKASDARIFAAPYYGRAVLDRYSYPALLHLASFTDVNNFFQKSALRPYSFVRHRTGAADPEPIDARLKTWEFTRRTPAHQRRMSLAVKTGLLFSVFTAVAVPLLAFRRFYAAVIEREEQHALWLVMACLSGAWFLNVVAFFPFIPSVYKHGFWLPRLVAPALCVFLGLAFAGLDKLLPPHRPAWQWLCLLAACLQSWLHLSFLWA